MKKNICLLLISVLGITVAIGQTKVTLYYNSAAELTSPEKSSFKRDTYLDFSKMVLDGSYKDHNMQGELIGEGSYNNGVPSGHHKVYINNKLVADIEYSGNSFVLWEHTNQEGNSSVTDRTGQFSLDFIYYERYYELGNWKSGTLTGEFKKGQKVGKWVYESHDKGIKYEETYQKGEFKKRFGYGKNSVNEFKEPLEISPLFYSSNAEKLNYDKSVYNNLYAFFEQNPPSDIDSLQRNITYPGGIVKLMKEIGGNLEYPAADRRTRTQGQVIINVTIDEHGVVKSKQVLKSASKTLEIEALRVLELFEDKFCPASLAGKTYESTLAIPVSFRLGVR